MKELLSRERVTCQCHLTFRVLPFELRFSVQFWQPAPSQLPVTEFEAYTTFCWKLRHISFVSVWLWPLTSFAAWLSFLSVLVFLGLSILTSRRVWRLSRFVAVLCIKNLQTNNCLTHSFIHFCHAPLRVRSTKRRHQSPEWVILSQVDCFIQGESNDSKSCWIVFIHVVWGRPGGLLQFSRREAVKIFIRQTRNVSKQGQTPCLNNGWDGSLLYCPSYIIIKSVLSNDSMIG